MFASIGWKIINPAKRFTKEAWDKGFTLMDKAKKNTKNYSPREVKQSIDQAVREVRQSKRV